MKTRIGLALVLSFSLGFLSFEGYTAEGHFFQKSGQCQKGASGFSRDRGLKSKVFAKLHSIIKNKQELDLSEEQIDKISDLKLTFKKNKIRQEAEIEILSIDIKAKMRKDPVDLEEINKLIDQKYELKKAQAKSLVETCVGLDSVLTDKQKEKLKSLKKEFKKERKGS